MIYYDTSLANKIEWFDAGVLRNNVELSKNIIKSLTTQVILLHCYELIFGCQLIRNCKLTRLSNLWIKMKIL